MSTAASATTSEYLTSFLPWTRSYCGQDVFRPPVWPELSVEDLLNGAKAEGASAIQVHHDEAGFMPAGMAVDDFKSIEKTWNESAPRLRERGLVLEGIAPRLWQDPRFSNGALTNPNPEYRDLAIRVAQETVNIAAEHDFNFVIWWLAREGMYTPGELASDRWNLLFDAFHQILSHNPDVRHVIEAKPEDPTVNAVVPTVGHAMWLRSKLDPAHQQQVGLLIEFAHSILARVKPAYDISMALNDGVLWGLHANDQPNPSLDLDLPVGTASLLGAFEIMIALVDGNYFDGTRYIGFDVKPHSNVDQAERHSGVEYSNRLTRKLFDRARSVDFERLRKARPHEKTELMHQYLMGEL